MSEFKYTEQSIQKCLNGFFASWKYNVDNLYVFPWESDKLLWTKAGYIYEFEIKISRADYKNDFKHKADKHLLFSSKIEKPEMLQQDLFANLQKREQKKYPQITAEQVKRRCYPENTKLPNYFYYAVPKGMIQVDEVPEYAGLIWIEDEHLFRIMKKAPCLHKEKYTDAQLNLGEKFYYNWQTTKQVLRNAEKNTEYYKAQLQHEIESKGHECSWDELKSEVEKWKREAKIKANLYLTMVEGADYNSIERRMLIQKIKEFDPNFDYTAFMKEVDKKYKERYPNRK